MLTKESKMRVLENFYAIDLTLFGKSVSKIETCCEETVKEYVTTKGALLSVIVEMNKYINHSPDSISEMVNDEKLQSMARKSAKIARENAHKLVACEKGKEDIKNALRENLGSNKNNVAIEDLVQETIRTKTFALALDNLLIARTISESGSFEKLNEIEGQILEDAYKILRDNLVDLSLFIDEYANLTR